MARVRPGLIAALLMSACATAPASKPAAPQHAPADAFAMRKPDHVARSSDTKLGELRAVPAAKAASEPDPQPGPPDPVERY